MEKETYIDLGLPSGTLWADQNEDGYHTYDETVEKFGNALPTREQFVELKNSCQWKWQDGGYKVTGSNGKSIFLPAAGFRYGTKVLCAGKSGFYWSASFYDENYAENYARLVDFGEDYALADYWSFRSSSLSVRLVKPKTEPKETQVTKTLDLGNSGLRCPIDKINLPLTCDEALELYKATTRVALVLKFSSDLDDFEAQQCFEAIADKLNALLNQ